MRNPGETNEFFTVFDRADLLGRIASYRLPGVLCGCYGSTEGTLGTLKKANQIPICLPHARDRDLEETWFLSEVQDGTG
jgi:hypothetical protein